MAKKSRVAEDHGYPGAEWREFYARRAVPQKKIRMNHDIIFEELERKISEHALNFLREARRVEAPEQHADRAELLWKYGYITNSDFFKRSKEIIDAEFYRIVAEKSVIYSPQKTQVQLELFR